MLNDGYRERRFSFLAKQQGVAEHTFDRAMRDGKANAVLKLFFLALACLGSLW